MSTLRSLVVTSVMLVFGFSPAIADSWQSIGPQAGSVFNVAIHPSNSQIILLAGYLNGAHRTYRTEDGGATYSELPFAASNLFYDPVDANTVYALASYLERSIDGGVTWSQVSTFYPGAAAVAQSNPNRLYAGEAFSNGMYTSTNAGATWTPVTTFTYEAGTGAIAVHPTNASIVFAGTYGTWDYSGEGLFKSTNAGTSWTHISSPVIYGNVNSIAIDPSNPLVMYCSTEGGGFYNGNGVLKSTDGGTTWAQSGFPNAGVREVLIDPLHTNRVYANVYGNIHVSNDGGASWAPIRDGISDIDLMRTNTDVLCAGGGGVLVSEDAGASFAQWGVEPVDLTAVRVDRTNGNTLYGTGRGLYRTSDGAGMWESVGSIAFATAVIQDPVNASILYNGAYSNGGVTKSIDSGDTWSLSLANKSINDVAVAPTNPSIVYACGLDQPQVGGIFRSVNSGGNWAKVHGSINKTIEVHPLNDDIVYAGGAGGVIKSVDGGTTWAPVNNGLDNPASGTVFELVIDPTNPEIVYCGTQNHGVYKSNDGGAQWTRLTSTMTDVRALEFDPADVQVVYAAAYFEGIFVTVNGGQTWSMLGAPILGRTDVTVDPSDRNTLYMAGGGVWRYVRTSVCAVPAIESYEPAVVNLAGCEGGCTVTFDVGTGDDYSQAAVVALERKSGNVWIQEDEILAPLAAAPWQLSHTFLPTDDPGDYVFRAVIRGADGSRAVSDEATVTAGSGPTAVPSSPLALELGQNRPNPFNPSTTISFQMPAAGPARLAVYNVNGELVSVLLDRTVTAGNNDVVWNGRDGSGRSVSSGIYFYRLTTLGHTLTRRMVLLK